MELILTDKERELLGIVLEERHRSLLREISHTDHITFKRVRREKEGLLDSVLQKVSALESEVLLETA